jgi:hypothetical protein
MAWSRGMTLVQDALDIATREGNNTEGWVSDILGQHFDSIECGPMPFGNVGTYRQAVDNIILCFGDTYEAVEVKVCVDVDGRRFIHCVSGLQGSKWTYNNGVRVSLDYIQEG